MTATKHRAFRMSGRKSCSMDSSECLPYETKFEVQWRGLAASSHHQAVFQIVQRLKISGRVDRAAKAKACNNIMMIYLEDMDD